MVNVSQIHVTAGANSLDVTYLQGCILWFCVICVETFKIKECCVVFDLTETGIQPKSANHKSGTAKGFD